LRNAKHGCNQSVFGIHVKEINEPASLETLGHYVEATITMTLFTVYIVITFQKDSLFHDEGARLPKRAAWLILFLWNLQAREKKAREKTADDMV
jgi:hypothetical protein